MTDFVTVDAFTYNIIDKSNPSKIYVQRYKLFITYLFLE